jgi:hypothetical protein
MRRKFVLRPDGQGGYQLVEIDMEAPPRPSLAPAVHGDIGGYRSMRTGEWISSRSEHREHLHRYGLTEVGNELATVMRRPEIAGPAPGEVAEEVQRQLQRDPGERRAEAETVLRRAGYEGPQVERILSQ